MQLKGVKKAGQKPVGKVNQGATHLLDLIAALQEFRLSIAKP